MEHPLFVYWIRWNTTEDALFPYQATINDQIWLIRINDFPDEPLYTLIIEKREIIDFDDWPKTWSK
jgi:hypothetical protein